MVASTLALGALALVWPRGSCHHDSTRSDAQYVSSAVALYLGQEPGSPCPTVERLIESGVLDPRTPHP